MRRSTPIEEIWASGLFIGANRADTRVTVDREWAVKDEWTAAGSDRTGFHSKRRPARYYQDMDVDEAEEVPLSIIKSVEIVRQLDADAAGLTLTLTNAHPTAGPKKTEQGRFSPRRSFRDPDGELRLIQAGDDRWGDLGLEANEWSVIYTNEDVYNSRGQRKRVHSYGTLASGNMLRVYQGYGGADKTLAEALEDGNLVQTGCFVIDDASYTADGVITLAARDIGVLLLEQQLYPPMIPEYCYPMQFYSSNWNSAAGYGSEGVIPTRTNYRDLADPVRLIALWSGFHLKGGGWAADRRFPAIHGAIENTGIASESVLAAQMFDKKNAVDPIREISSIVSYMMWIDQEGGFRWHCADEETEVLSKRGWLTHDQLEIGDLVLSIDPATDCSVWKPVTNINRNHVVDQEMVSIEGQGHSSLTTTNHRWWIPGQRRGRAGRWTTSDAFTWEDRIPRAAPRGDAPVDAKFSDELVELVAWWVTEGTWKGAGGTPGRSGAICQDTAANGPYCDRIQLIFEKLFGPEGPRRSGKHMEPSVLNEAAAMIAAGERTNTIAAAVGIDRHTVADWKRDGVPEVHPLWRSHMRGTLKNWKFGPEIASELWALAPDRIPTMDFLTNLTTDQARLFVETCIDGDGNRYEVKGQTYSRWTQKDERSVRAFEVACALAGVATSTAHRENGYPGGCFEVQLLTVPTFSPKAQKGKAISTQRYTGTVWCPTVEDTQTWLARRNGTVYFTGNSPNIWEAGNFDYDGQHTRFAFEIDETKGLLDYTVINSRKADRARLTVAQADPYKNGPGTVKIASYDTWTSSTKPQIHGMHNQATWSLYDKKANISHADMVTLAELTGLRTWFSRRAGSVSAPALPLIDIDDQIRVVERVTFDMYLHRVLAMTTTHDLDSGAYIMNINTHWLGADPNGWAVRISDTGHVTYNTGTGSGTSLGRPRRAITSRQPASTMSDRDVWA